MAKSDLDDLYGKTVLEHCRSPRNHDRLVDADATAHTVNAFCGDESDVQISVDGGRVVGVGAQAAGCSVNLAATSMLAQAAEGVHLDDLSSLIDLFRRQMKGEALSEGDRSRLGDLATLTGVLNFPVRIKCTLLSVSALEEALATVDGS
jgi:nitrogen fixation NifU-like protein